MHISTVWIRKCYCSYKEDRGCERIGSPLPPSWILVLNSAWQTWKQVPLPTYPLWCPIWLLFSFRGKHNSWEHQSSENNCQWWKLWLENNRVPATLTVSSTPMDSCYWIFVPLSPLPSGCKNKPFSPSQAPLVEDLSHTLFPSTVKAWSPQLCIRTLIWNFWPYSHSFNQATSPAAHSRTKSLETSCIVTHMPSVYNTWLLQAPCHIH